MPSSTLERFSGGAWVAETSVIRLTLTDTLYYPFTLSATLSNIENVSYPNYTNYQEVRVTEPTTGQILFYGKIEQIRPRNDANYGQVLDLFARDNLNELLKAVVDQDYTGDGFTRRSALVARIVAGYSYSGNLDTDDAAKFEASAVAEPAAQLDLDYRGSGKNALRAIAELAQEDPWDAIPTGFGYVYYLDATFAGVSPDPDLHYFLRGSRPAGGAAANGLTIFYGGAEADQTRSMFADYSFSTESAEMATIVRIEYVDATEVPQSFRVTLLNLSGAVGTFTVGETISAPSRGRAVVQYRATDGSFVVVSGYFLAGGTHTGAGGAATLTDATAAFVTRGVRPGLLITNLTDSSSGTITAVTQTTITATLTGGTGNDWDMGDSYEIGLGDGWFGNWAIGEVITGGLSGATATVASAPRQTIAQDVEIVLREWEFKSLDEVRDRAAELLYHKATTVLRGDVGVLLWPFYRILGVYTLVRTGTVVRITGVPNITNQDMLVTKIVYDEGPGIQTCRVHVLGTARGVADLPNPLEEIAKTAETALWQTIGASGGLPASAQLVNLGFTFTTPAWNQIAWPGGTATFSDGSTLTINTTGSPYTIPDASLRYIYLISGNSTLQISASFSDVVGNNRTLVAIAQRNADTAIPANLVSMNSGTPIIFAGSIVTNQLSAITANMGLLTAGEIRVGTGTVGVNFTGFRVTPSYIAGYNADALQAYIQASDGKLYGGAGAVVIDSTGVTFDGDVSTSVARFKNNPNQTIVMYNDGAGALGALIIVPIGAGTAPDSITSYINRFQFTAGTWYLSSLSVPSTAVLEIGAGGTLRSSAAGSALGTSGQPWGTAYIRTVLRDAAGGAIGDATNVFANGYFSTVNTDVILKLGAGGSGQIGNNASDFFLNAYLGTVNINEVRRLTGVAGGDIGTSAAYFNNLYVGQTGNRITGAGGDMDFYTNSSLTASFADGDPADGYTAFYIKVTKGAATSVQLVSLGTSDSGGAGYRLLRVAN